MNSKLFRCNIHKSIRISGLALKIINTPEFQRLKDIKQLGKAHYIFPTAVHTRYEHSIGVYHLAGKMLQEIIYKYPNKKYDLPILSDNPIKLDNLIIECIKIAGLCHDIGHGPYSHTFDNILKSTNCKYKEHEERSCLILEILCRRALSDVLNDKHIKFMKSIINPTKENKGALYQIVCNNLNGIDVDKFDYLVRDSKNSACKISFSFERLIKEFIIDQNGNIAYPKHCSLDIYDMFNSRYLMHKKIYSNKTCIILDTMLVDVLNNIAGIIKLDEIVDNMESFCKLTDDYFVNLINIIVDTPFYLSVNFDADTINTFKKSKVVLDRILARQLYTIILEISDSETSKDFLNLLIENICNKYNFINKDDFLVRRTKIGFVAADKPDPFDSVYYYDISEENKNSFKINKKLIIPMTNNNISEIKWYLIYKPFDHVELVSNFLKKYDAKL